MESSPEGGDKRLAVIPDSHGHAKGEHKPFAEERPIPYTARMLFLWFFHACRRGAPRFMLVADHMNYLTFEDPAAVNLVRRALKLAQAGDLYGAAETADVEVGHAQVVSEGLRRGMRYSIGAEVDNDPRSRPDAQNIVDAMKPDGLVRSVHFLPITHPTHGENWMWAFDNPEFKDLYEVVGTDKVWETYMTVLLDAVEKLPGHIVGHFYVPAIFGHWPADDVLEGYEDKLVDACAERGMAIEVNSRYLYRHYVGDEAQLAKFRAVHLRLMRKATAKGVAIAVGSDAHSPKDQSRGFDAVLELLDEAEINEIAFPIGGRLARVALRVTEEILKQFAPPEPEPVAPPPAPEPVAAAPEASEATEAAPAAKPKKARPSRAKAAPAPDEATGDAPPVEPKPEPEPKPKSKPKSGVAALAAAAVETAAKAVETIVASVRPAAAKPTAAKTPAAKAPTSKPAAKPAKKPAVPAKKAAAKKAVPPAKKSAPVKASASKKAAAKKPVAKKAVAKAKPAAKKAVAKKPVAKKAVAKKTPPKKPVAKKAAAKSASAKKSVVKKSATKKSAPKAVKRSAAAKRPAVKKTAAKKSARRARR